MCDNLFIICIPPGSPALSPPPGSPYASVTVALGTYVLHYFASSFLAADSLTWVVGPPLSVALQCAARLSEASFLLVGGEDRRSVRQYDTGTTAETATQFWNWQPASTWPSLEIGRFSPACLVFNGQLVVAGGWEFPSVETIDLVTKALVRGKQMKRPRVHFQLASFGEEGYRRLLALGGDSGVSTLGTVEWLQEETGHWQEAAGRLAMARSGHGAVEVTAQMLKCTGECEGCTQQGRESAVIKKLLRFSKVKQTLVMNAHFVPKERDNSGKCFLQ